MAAATIRPLLLLPFLLLLVIHVSSVTGYDGAPISGVRWLEEGRSVLIRLAIPNLPLWNATEQIGEDVPTGLVLNFTLTPDRRTLLLQDEPILPLPNPNVPPHLAAPQTSQSQLAFEHDEIFDLDDAPLFDLDYARLVQPRDDPSIRYYNHIPTLTIDLLGAGIAGYNTLLKDPEQKVVKIRLKADQNPYTPESAFMITHVQVPRRGHNDLWIDPDELAECTLFSWRCAKFSDAPWYQYIYRVQFDEYGRIGSLRHEMLQRWGMLNQRLGYWQAVLLVFVVVSMTLSPLIYGIYKGICWLKQYHKARKESKASWDVDEEEAEGLLVEDVEQGGDFALSIPEEEEDPVEESKINEKQEEEKQSEKVEVEEGQEVDSLLPPVPANTSSSQ